MNELKVPNRTAVKRLVQAVLLKRLWTAQLRVFAVTPWTALPFATDYAKVRHAYSRILAFFRSKSVII